MKRPLIIAIGIIIFFTACDVLQELAQGAVNLPQNQNFDNLINTFNQQSPISTTFDDADYEAVALHDFEPNQSAYMPLDIQPKNESGSYILKSGLYSMNAKSFCLRGYTHGPSRGDGHLYAPLKGKKSDLVQAIIEKYGNKPEIEQKNIQVLLWAIIAGADMNSLGEQHSKTLNELFTIQELLEFQGKDLLSGFADNQLNELKILAFSNTKLKNLLEADNKIRNMVQQNKSFQEIEKVAIIAGAAPREDMIREVSKGRWSNHPDGYFIRFFPNGYAQTRLDIYVPFEGEKVQTISEGLNSPSASSDYRLIKEVNFNPAQHVAVPANQSSQKIGISACPVTPFPYYRFPETGCNPNSIFEPESARYSKKVDKIEVRGSIKFINMVTKALSVLKKDAPEYYKYYISNNTPNKKNILRGIGLDCHYGSHTIDAFQYARLVVENEWRYNRFNDNPEITAGIIIHEAVHVHQADAYMKTIGNGNYENFLKYYGQNRRSFEGAASDKQIDYLKFALSKYNKGTPKYTLIEQEIKRVQEYKNSY